MVVKYRPGNPLEYTGNHLEYTAHCTIQQSPVLVPQSRLVYPYSIQSLTILTIHGSLLFTAGPRRRIDLVTATPTDPPLLAHAGTALIERQASPNPARHKHPRIDLGYLSAPPASVTTSPFKRPNCLLAPPYRTKRASNQFGHRLHLQPIDSAKLPRLHLHHFQLTDAPSCQQSAPPISPSNMLTYTEYYQSTPSPLGVGPARDLAYQTIYDYFAEETATPILLNRLLDLFEPEAVGALGIFLTDTFGKARLRLVHGLRKYPGPLTAPSTNKGKAFGYLDDIEGDAGELVLVDAALLEQAPETLVLSLDRHLDVIKHAHHSHIIPMVLGDDPHMEVITPFKACFIPFQLVPLLLGKGLSP
eukprot:jgi/Psemu1/5874/gm1.5874_g